MLNGPYSLEGEGDEPGPSPIQVTFDSLKAFTSEYQAHIARGGLFVESEETFELLSPVRVQIHLAFCGEYVELEGQVVNYVPAGLAGSGARAGVAIQLEWPAERLREVFGAFLSDSQPQEKEQPDPRRKKARAPAKLLAKIGTRKAVVAGRTRDLSLGGALISVASEPPPVGTAVQMMIRHSNGADEMLIPARIVRHLVTESGEVSAVAVQFEPEEDRVGETERFIEEVAIAEQARRIGGVSGAIAERGLAAVLEEFAQSSRFGTLTVSCGAEEGVIGFEDRQLRVATLGQASGIDALARMLTWQDGAYEFHARSERTGEPPLSVPLDEAILEALGREVARPLETEAGDA